jgi:hypothetical protein
VKALSCKAEAAYAVLAHDTAHGWHHCCLLGILQSLYTESWKVAFHQEKPSSSFHVLIPKML